MPAPTLRIAQRSREPGGTLGPCSKSSRGHHGSDDLTLVISVFLWGVRTGVFLRQMCSFSTHKMVVRSQGEDFSRGFEVQSPYFPSSLWRIIGGFATGFPIANSLCDYLR
ncbi:hypothetical protein V6N13_018876 [Hibiscus sabdariffa]